MKSFIIALALSALTFSTTAQAGLLQTASSFTGLNEHRNKAQLKRLLGVNPSRVAWCGYFLGSIVKMNGRKPPKGFQLAQGWMKYGKAVRLSSAKAGDVVIVRTRRGYHVGILKSQTRTEVSLVGGNQSNSVQASAFAKRSVVAVRR